jgi:hypothetical protein
VKRSLFIVLVAFFGMFCVVAVSADSFAAERKSSIRERIDVLQERIDQGIRSGALTRREAARVQSELDDVRKERAKMKEDDGRISDRERARLHRRLDEVGKLIYKEKHDTQKRD